MSSKEAKDRLRKLTMLEYNKSCANCKAPRPTWTSLIILPEKEEIEVDESIPKMLGVFICFRCSAIQRRIGSNFCSVKRMALDMWTEEELKAIELGGNNVVNSAYEAKEVTGRPEPRALVNPRKVFLKEKYVERKFLDMDKLDEVLQWISLSQVEQEEETKGEGKEQEKGKHSDDFSLSSSLHFDEGKLFPTPQVTRKTASSSAPMDLDATDENGSAEFPEDFPNFPDFDSSRPDLMKEKSEVGGFADVRQSFLASVPETKLASKDSAMSFDDDFSDDKFNEDDDSSEDAAEPQSSKPETPIAFGDLFTEDDKSEEDAFGEALDSSFSPKAKAGEQSDAGDRPDSLFVDGASLPQLPIESEEPKSAQENDKSSSHSSHMSHSSHSSRSSADERFRATYDAGEPGSQDPFGEELSFPEQPLPPANDVLRSLDEPFETDGFDTQNTKDPFESDDGEANVDVPSGESGFRENVGPQTLFDAETSSRDDPKSLQTPSQPLDSSFKVDPFDAQDVSNTDPFSLDATEKTQSLETFPKVDSFGEQDTRNEDPSSFNGADNDFRRNSFDTETSSSDEEMSSPQTSGQADPFDGENASSTDPFSTYVADNTEPKEFSFKASAFGDPETASADPFSFKADAFDGQNASSAEPFSFDTSEKGQSMETSFNTDAFGDQETTNADQFAFDKPSNSQEDFGEDPFGADTFGADAFGEQTGTSADAFGNDFSVSANRDGEFEPPFISSSNDFFKVDNSSNVDSLSQSERVGFNGANAFGGDSFSKSERVGSGSHPAFHVTPSHQRKAKSDDGESSGEVEPKKKKKKKKPPSLDSAFKKMSQADVTIRTDGASIASSSSKLSVRSARTAPIRARSRSADRDDELSTPSSAGSRGKRHTMSIGSRSFNSSQQRRKPKPRHSREKSLDRGASWGDTLPEEGGANDAFPPRAASMDGRFLGFDDNDSDDGFNQSLSQNERKESRFGGSRKERQSRNSRAQKPTRSLSPFTEVTRATKGKSTTSEEEPGVSHQTDEDMDFEQTFRALQRTRSLNVETGARSTRRMPERDEKGTVDDGFSNPSTNRVTMAGWSAGNSNSEIESTGSSVNSNTVTSFTHVADELSAAAFDKDDLPTRRASSDSTGPKQRNRLVKIESARSKVRKKEQELAGLMQDTERRKSLQPTPSLRMKLEADDAEFVRHATSVDGGRERHEMQDSKRKIVLFRGKTTNTPEPSETR
ncbi:MAG: hypothetical protein SGBAC_011659 [Bacillariaceae sp.]